LIFVNKTRVDALEGAKSEIETLAAFIGAALDASRASDADRLNLVKTALPRRLAPPGRRIYVTDAQGEIVGSLNAGDDARGLLASKLGGALPIVLFGAKAGVL